METVYQYTYFLVKCVLNTFSHSWPWGTQFQRWFSTSVQTQAECCVMLH